MTDLALPVPLPPGVIMMLGALALPLLPGLARSLWLLLVPAATLALVWTVPDGVPLTGSFLGYTLELVQGDRLSRLFATVFALAALFGSLYALRQRSTLELMAAQIYAGGAIGVTFAGDLFTLFLFWEVMAVASATVIWAARTDRAYAAGMRYLIIHLLGGVVMMAGIAAFVVETGSIDFVAMTPENVGTWLILIGVLVNAGAPPLSAWVADAYPSASWSGTVFLSAFTTKTAVYVLIRGFPGAEVLIWVGLAMIFYGVVYALLAGDMRRLLVYSIVNQVGFMLVGVGIGTDLALNGAAAHAFAHIAYKALLLMSAGAVMQRTGTTRMSDLGGLFRSMPLTMACGLIGALSISAVPLTSGFVSKSMIISASGEEHLFWVWLLLETASAAAILYCGLRFPWFTFFGRDSGLRPAEAPRSMQAAMVGLAAVCIGLGVYPQALYGLLPFPVDYVPYTGAHVVHQMQLLVFAAGAFFLLLPVMRPKATLTLDTDWLYRRLFRVVEQAAAHRYVQAKELLLTLVRAGVAAIVRLIEAHHGPGGVLVRTWALSSATLWVVALLALYLLLYYF